MTIMIEAPPIVWALIAHIEQAGPNPPMPIAWAEAAGIWTIVLEDGRKIRFLKELDPQPKAIPLPTPVLRRTKVTAIGAKKETK